MSKPETKKMVAHKKDCNFKSKAQKVRIWCIPLISRCSLCLIFVGSMPVCFSRTSCIKSLIFVSTTEYSTTLCSFFWNERSTSLIKNSASEDRHKYSRNISPTESTFWERTGGPSQVMSQPVRRTIHKQKWDFTHTFKHLWRSSSPKPKGENIIILLWIALIATKQSVPKVAFHHLLCLIQITASEFPLSYLVLGQQNLHGTRFWPQ